MSKKPRIKKVTEKLEVPVYMGSVPVIPVKCRKRGRKDSWNNEPIRNSAVPAGVYHLDFADPSFNDALFTESLDSYHRPFMTDIFFNEAARKSLQLEGGYIVNLRAPEYSRNGGVQLGFTYYFPPESAKKLGLLERWNGTRWNCRKETNEELIEKYRKAAAYWKEMTKEQKKSYKLMTVEITGNKIKYLTKKL
jgi:hypothetical protein